VETLYDTFNMGIGFVLIVPPSVAEEITTFLKKQQINAYDIGEVISGDGEVTGLE
jgi:phosphoribosylformylglycinamidine cyclo-ligase